MTKSIYEEITDTIISAIEAGTGDFHMPWHRGGLRPQNALTEAQYRGVNILQLIISQSRQAFEGHYWATFNQWRELGARVLKGAKGTTVVFYKTLVQEEESEDPAATEPELKKFPMLKRSTVFNAEQVDGWRAPEQPLTDLTRRIARADEFVTGTGADIRHGGVEAFYRPSEDYIQMPLRERFIGTETSDATECYYSTLLHELVHWSGHAARCDRADLGKRFGSAAYAMEELVAEMGAAYLCADLTISLTVRPDHAQYIAHWLKVLREDRTAIFTASNRATKALDYLHELQGKPAADKGPAPTTIRPASEENQALRYIDETRNTAQTLMERVEQGREKRRRAKAQKQGKLF